MTSRLIPALVSLLALAGCETVTSTQPLGESPTQIETTAWAGVWHNEDEQLKLEILDATQGKVRIDFEVDGQAENMTLWLRDSGGWTFFNVLQADVDEENRALPGSDQRYFWGRVVKEPNRIVVWGPEPVRFVNLVSKGILPGSVHEGSAVLEALGPEHHRIITSRDHGVLMDWESPLVLFREDATQPQTEEEPIP